MKSVAFSGRVICRLFRWIWKSKGRQEQKNWKICCVEVAEQARNYEGPANRSRIQ
jgi:hypothetical protein